MALSPKPATSSTSSTSLDARISSALQARADKGMLRRLASLETIGARDPTESRMVDFSSNDYLSFSQSSKLHSNFVKALASESTSAFGPPGSRLLDGNSVKHLLLEKQLARFFHSPYSQSGESALLFNSGHNANVSIFSTLPSSEDYFLFDALIHASVHDGIRASRVPKHHRISFAHNSVESFEKTLNAICQANIKIVKGEADVWVAVEALYSMDGDIAPLRETSAVLTRLLPNGNGHLIVDEAHSTGLYGPSGRGLTCALGMEDQVLVRLHTFGKAMACSGAVAILPPLLRMYLINYARPLIFSTAMPCFNVIAMRESITMLESADGAAATRKLQALYGHTVWGLTKVASECPSSLRFEPLKLIPETPFSPIIPLLTKHCIALSRHLQANRFLVRPIRYPTVPKGQERIRICLHAGNTTREMDGLLNEISNWFSCSQSHLLSESLWSRSGAASSAKKPTEVNKSELPEGKSKDFLRLSRKEGLRTIAKARL